MVSRRDWLKLSLAAGVSGALGCSGNSANRDAGNPPLDTDHAVAAFEVDSTSAIIAAYAANPRVALVVVEDEAGMQTVYGPLNITAGAGDTGSLLIDGLDPDTQYGFHLSFQGGTVSHTCAFRTAPELDQEKQFSFIFSADIDVSPEFDSPIFDNMASSGASFFVSLGDWPYADNAPGAETLAQYRARHKQVRVAPKVQRLLEAMPAYAIYDDHEVWNNWDAAFRSREQARVENALIAWDEWFPLRNTGDPRVRYRSWRWGKHAEFFLLDTRLYRGVNADPNAPDKTMLGATQKAWLFSALRDSEATFKFIFTTVPLEFARSLAPFADDHWAVYSHERDELLAHIRDNNIGGTLFLAADQHWFAAHHFNAGHKEFQVGPLARGLFDLPPADEQVVARSAEYNYGELIVRAGPPAQVVFNCRGATGDVIYSETIDAD